MFKFCSYASSAKSLTFYRHKDKGSKSQLKLFVMIMDYSDRTVEVMRLDECVAGLLDTCTCHTHFSIVINKMLINVKI